MTTATIAEMESRHQWFQRLDAEHRSQITLVAQAGIDGFVKWFANPDPRGPTTSRCSAPHPELTQDFPAPDCRTRAHHHRRRGSRDRPTRRKGDRPVLHAAIVQYSREVAFAAAEIYARAAELRGAWDAVLKRW